MEQINERAPKTNNKRIVLGIVFITLAALLFADNFDIMCESKWKNIASFKLHDTYTDRVNNVQ